MRKRQAKEGRTRMNLVLSQRSMERLERLRDKTEADSFAEVFRKALRLYEALIADAEAGKEFLVKEPDGTMKSSRIFLD